MCICISILLWNFTWSSLKRLSDRVFNRYQPDLSESLKISIMSWNIVDGEKVSVNRMVNHIEKCYNPTSTSFRK